ncbi:hypothetical protein ACHQM5_015649 [Ranunculus cassubicifolius]
MHRAGSSIDGYTFTPVIGACSALTDILRGQQLHSLFIKICSDSESIPKTALIDMYFKCDLYTNAVKVFEEMKTKDVITWNTVISGLLRHNKGRYAISVFEAMRDEKVKYSGFILCSVVKACALLKAIRQGKQVHAVVIVMGSDLLVLSTALVDLYSRCALVDEAMKVFYSLDCWKDKAIYNALFCGCIQNRKYKEAGLILSRMRPNEITLTSALSISSMHSDLFIGKQIHCAAIRFGLEDTQLSNAIFDMYAKCGKITTARLLFDGLPHRTVVSWTSIIDAYGRQGCGIEAYNLFKEMEKSGISPNSVTFLAVLSACGHSGLVAEGRHCFVSMRKTYGIDPGPEHYACFMDLLGRAGLMEEVWDLFNDIGKNGGTATAPVVAALLHACRVDLDVERGEFAAKCLIELKPDEPSTFVALSNFYAAIERWDRVEELRKLMIEKGLRKETGSSWIGE